MENIAALVMAHLSLYPGMEVADCIKLMYQNELGGGHLIEDEALYATKIREELRGPLLGAAPAQVEDIGNARRRVPLSALGGDVRAETFTKLAARSARLYGGDKEALREKLLVLRQMAAAGRLPYDAQRAVEEIDAYLVAGMPAVRHSGRFKALYSPHYRILDEASALFLPVFAAIDVALGQKPHVLAGIDGMCGAGKSALADMVCEVYGCGAVHTDDFFLRNEQRSHERLAQAGGNIDYERLAPVAAEAGKRFPFQYQAYDCKTAALGAVREVPGGPLTLLEGAYALHPKANAPCDVRVFLAVDAAMQQRRLWQREGQENYARFVEEWIPMENHYFAEYGIRQGCDVVVDTSEIWVGEG